MSLTLTLPAALEPYRDAILATKQPFVRALSQPARKLALWESKVGGLPYLPKDMVFPTAPDGRELFFLAQINFAEMPALPPFPTEGMVQFYIHDDDLYGMNFDDGENPDTFRVLFHPKVEKNEAALQTKFPVLRNYDELLPHHPEESYQL